jgi:ParB/RepB/Spo0J family partition protein
MSKPTLKTAKPTLRQIPNALELATRKAQESVEQVLVQDGGKSPSVSLVRLDLLESNPFQPRKSFDEDALAELADSLKEHGQLQPIVVAAGGADKRLVIVCGERRVRAARSLGWTDIEAKVYPSITQRQLQMIALVENLNREDLSPFEVSASFLAFVSQGGTVEEMAAATGRKPVTIQRYLKLNELNPDVAEAGRAAGLGFKRLYDLASSDLDVARQLRLIELWNSGASLSVADIRAAVSPAGPSANGKKEKSPAPAVTEGLLAGKTKWIAKADEPGKEKAVAFTVVVQARRNEIAPPVFRAGLAQVIKQSFGEDIDVLDALRRALDEIEQARKG